MTDGRSGDGPSDHRNEDFQSAGHAGTGLEPDNPDVRERPKLERDLSPELTPEFRREYLHLDQVEVHGVAAEGAVHSSSAVARTPSQPASVGPRSFSIGADSFLLDGKPFHIRCGEIHASRVPRAYWWHRLRMARAMGLNTVSTYQFWNLVEQREGVFDWSGRADIAEFCRVAQSEDLWVLVRPGPYVCAEWEMGGLPWWLLKESDIALRSRDPRFMTAAMRYLREVARVLQPLQITEGGPILMVQIENEYGSYGSDSEYIKEAQQAFVDAGLKVPLFTCNPPHVLENGHVADLLPTVNFASEPARNFAKLREIWPSGPVMCGELYSGWFDTWGRPHHSGNVQHHLRDVEAMLAAGHSFSIYMAHGGTTFGLWSGADRPFKPDTSSYDYDAPISEAGWPRRQFFEIRSLLERHLLPGERLPDPPASHLVIAIPETPVAESVLLLARLPPGIEATTPQTMEQCDQGYGCIAYRTTLEEGPEANLRVGAVHDLGLVFLDGVLIGTMDRRTRRFSLRLPGRTRRMVLDIFVEAMGRVNFGVEMRDRKGIHAPVTVDGRELSGWEIFRLPLDERMLEGLTFGIGRSDGPALWRAKVALDRVGDTFLDLRPWSKGVAWVNGHCLGRFWSIGPTQTMFVPGAWLNCGTNEIVIFDLFGPDRAVIAGLEEPILDVLRPERDVTELRRLQTIVRLRNEDLVMTGQFAEGAQPQTRQFEAPARGRYFCLEALSAFGGSDAAAVAELDLLDDAGASLDHEAWTIAYVDSEEWDREDGAAENAINGQTTDFWHTRWSGMQPGHPHRLVIDLGGTQSIFGFRYVPRQTPGGGRIKDYRVYVGDALVDAP